MLLITKLWLRSCHSLAPQRKTSWHKKAIDVKKKSFPLPLVEQIAIHVTQPLMVLFKICKCHLVQHMILIQMVYERSRGRKMANHWKKNAALFCLRRRKMIYRFAITEFYIIDYNYLDIWIE